MKMRFEYTVMVWWKFDLNGHY